MCLKCAYVSKTRVYWRMCLKHAYTGQVEFPLDPPLSKMLIMAEELRCNQEV